MVIAGSGPPQMTAGKVGLLNANVCFWLMLLKKSDGHRLRATIESKP
jgi:hypothetical protein